MEKINVVESALAMYRRAADEDRRERERRAAEDAQRAIATLAKWFGGAPDVLGVDIHNRLIIVDDEMSLEYDPTMLSGVRFRVWRPCPVCGEMVPGVWWAENATELGTAIAEWEPEYKHADKHIQTGTQRAVEAMPELLAAALDEDADVKTILRGIMAALVYVGTECAS